ncbi:PEP-CTERM sorting domain-containing protein [Alteromonas macleodii]|uniref:PEP-CTERM sorting domain-containing protein n=1 Tax=Alteromonas macleodii TaxID=28108 RepID=UPI002981FB76|nr:PEP-CTERM sorting domain-containing protein [Alteromonas macleodii]MDW5286388.1 PEP-CTERM sorting domain-containing protein [Alteromonas macleodii]
MKKIILMVLAIATFNANAAIIEISTDKPIYQVGETITATVSFSNEDAFLDRTLIVQTFDVYNTVIGFDATVINFVDASTLNPFGAINTLGDPISELFLPLTYFGGVLEIGSSIVDHFGGIDFIYQSTTPVIDLFSLKFVAQAAGTSALNGLEGSINFGGVFLGGENKEIEINSASFTVAQVPAPGTLALSLLALGGMVFARKRVKS